MVPGHDQAAEKGFVLDHHDWQSKGNVEPWVVILTWIAQGCGSCDAWLVCVSSGEMAYGCDGVSRMASFRGGGGGDDGDGVDVSAEPCPGWVPFVKFDGARPWIYRGCEDACVPYSGSSHAIGLVRASLMDVCRSRWCDVWRNPSQRVAPETMAWGRRCALVGGASPSLCP